MFESYILRYFHGGTEAPFKMSNLYYLNFDITLFKYIGSARLDKTIDVLYKGI